MLQRFVVTCLALLAPSLVLAESVETQKIITALTGDFNADDAADLVMIVETEPGQPFDVYFFLRDTEHNALKQTLIVRDQIIGEWNGYDRPGYENSDTQPTLTALANGSIKVFVPALPIGPDRTDETLILSYRSGGFVVSGFSYARENYLVENARETCEYNLLTGKGTRMATNADGTEATTTISVAARSVAFSDWNAAIAFEACGD